MVVKIILPNEIAELIRDSCGEYELYAVKIKDGHISIRDCRQGRIDGLGHYLRNDDVAVEVEDEHGRPIT